jgi:hypothetical protein
MIVNAARTSARATKCSVEVATCEAMAQAAVHQLDGGKRRPFGALRGTIFAARVDLPRAQCNPVQ